MPLSQYQMAQPGISQLGNLGNQIALGIAQKQYQQEILKRQLAIRQAEMQSKMALQRQQEALYGAQATAERAQAGHYDAQANKLNKEQQAAGVFGDLIRDYNRFPQNTQADILPLILGQAAQLAGQGQQHVPVNLAQLLQMNNQRAQQMMATGTKMTENVPAGGTLVDVLNQMVLERSPRTLAPGAALVPGQGGAPIAQAPNRPLSSNLGQLFGPLVNLRGQGMVSGVPVQQQNPTYQASDEAIRALIPLLMQGATNAPTAQTLGAPVEQQQPPQTTVPQVGEIRKGYRYKGGGPADKNNWEKVQ